MIKTFLKQRWVVRVAAFLLGALFVYAGYQKITDPQAFADSIATFELLPKTMIHLVALGLPPLEILLGVMLLVGRHARLASFGLLTLSIVFTAAVFQGIARGLEIDCGCFGGGAPSSTQAWTTLARDLVFIAVSAYVWRASTGNPGAPTGSPVAEDLNVPLENKLPSFDSSEPA